MALGTDGAAPYAPPATLLQVIERYRDRGLQTPFNPDVLVRAGVPESLASRVFQALKLLDLVDADGNPASVLEEYARAPQDEAQKKLRQVVEQAYAPVLAYVDPRNDSVDRIRDAFRGYEPRGQQERMVTLFLGLCEHVGIRDETPRRPSGTRPPSPRPSRPKSQRPRAAQTHQSQKGGPAAADQLSTAAGMLPAAVDGLLHELAKIGPTWTKERRDQFMAVWAAVIDFSYPVHEPADNADDEDDLQEVT